MSTSRGVVHELAGVNLLDLTLAYAITVHKAQGASFRRVVIPIQRTRLLDRSLVYMAITRATDLAVMEMRERCARRWSERHMPIVEKQRSEG